MFSTLKQCRVGGPLGCIQNLSQRYQLTPSYSKYGPSTNDAGGLLEMQLLGPSKLTASELWQELQGTIMPIKV